MDINVFREFTEIVLQGSYSAAAKTLNLSQPTLSRHVSALERELNTKLVADVQPVRLTPAGDAVFQTALSVSDLYAGMQDDLADLRRLVPSRIRIHDTPALKPLSARIVAAANATTHTHPRTMVEYVTLRQGKTPEEAVREGLCDLSFVQLVEETDEQYRRDSLRMVPITRTPSRILFGLPKGATASAETSLSALRHETFFLPARKSCEPLKATFAAACRKRGFRPIVKMLPFDRYEEFYLLDHGDGIHVLAEDDLEADPSFARRLEEHLTLVPLTDAEELGIRWHVLHRDPDEHSDGALVCFLELLTEHDPSLT